MGAVGAAGWRVRLVPPASDLWTELALEGVGVAWLLSRATAFPFDAVPSCTFCEGFGRGGGPMFPFSAVKVGFRAGVGSGGFPKLLEEDEGTDGRAGKDEVAVAGPGFCCRVEELGLDTSPHDPEVKVVGVVAVAVFEDSAQLDPFPDPDASGTGFQSDGPSPPPHPTPSPPQRFVLGCLAGAD